MKTIRCPECNLVNWATAADCKRCRFVFQTAEAVAAVETATVGGFQTAQNQFTDQSSFADLNSNSQDFGFQSDFQSRQTHSNYQQPGSNYAPPNYSQPNYYQSSYQPTNLKSGLAIASMVFGIISIVTALFLIGLLFAPIGLILGIVALVKASRKPDQYGGKGFAVAGIVTSAMVVLILPIIVAIAIPNLMAAARAANEGSAISSIRSISKSVGGNKVPGNMFTPCLTLKDMANAKSINEGLADGEYNGYRFVVTGITTGGCEVTATPLTTSHGTRSFYYSTMEGKIRGATKKGLLADRNDPTIE